MKKFFPLFIFLFLLFPSVSPASAYAGELDATVTYCYEGMTIVSGQVEKGTEITVIKYATAKNLLKEKGIELEDGTLYEWRMSSPEGEKVEKFIAGGNDTLYLVASEGVAEKRTITFRFDYVSEQSYRYESLEYDYGAPFTLPDTVDGEKITSEVYSSPEYATKNNNLWNIPSYVEEDQTVYVTLKEPAHITLNGKAYDTPYGVALVPPAASKNHLFVGFFTDQQCTCEYTGAAINGLTLYGFETRVSYSLTKVVVGTDTTTEEEMTYPVNDNIITRDVLPAVYVWTDEEGNTLDLPFVLARDMTVTGRVPAATVKKEERSNALTKEEIIAIVLVAAVFGGIGVFYLIKVVLKKNVFSRPKKKKSEENNEQGSSDEDQTKNDNNVKE